MGENNFIDKKRFTLDGPDDWRTYAKKNDNIVRNKRQWKAYRILIGTFNSDKYNQLLPQMIVPIIKLNYGNDYYYQEDNSRAHKSQKVQTFMKTL